jgi:hypothetical protein
MLKASLVFCGAAAALPTNAPANADLSPKALEAMSIEMGQIFEKHGFHQKNTHALVAEHVKAVPAISLHASETCKTAFGTYRTDLTATMEANDHRLSTKDKLVASHADFTCVCGINTDNCPSPPPSPPAPPPPLAYLPTTEEEASEITSLYNDMVWDDGNGRVYMHHSHGGNNQKFYIEPLNDHRFKIHIKGQPGMCLDRHTNENKVYMHGCHDGDNQKWYMVGGDMAGHDGAASIQSVDGGTGTCLDYAWHNDHDLVMYDCHDGDNQKFYFKHH